MEKKPQKDRDKPAFCCDNNFQFPTLQRYCNKYARFYHVNRLIKKPNPKDPEIIEFCVKNDYHIITHNKVNFKDYVQNTRVGIFYIGSQPLNTGLVNSLSILKIIQNIKILTTKLSS